MSVEQLDVVIAGKPERCRPCQNPLHGEEPQPRHHQVTGVPPVRPAMTDYHMRRLFCTRCGEAIRAKLGHPKSHRPCWEIPERRRALWMFVRYPEVEPTFKQQNRHVVRDLTDVLEQLVSPTA